jgi:hypothetical protein
LAKLISTAVSLLFQSYDPRFANCLASAADNPASDANADSIRAASNKGEATPVTAFTFCSLGTFLFDDSFTST